MDKGDKGFACAEYTTGQLNAMVKLLRQQAGRDAVERFLRGEITVSRPPRSWQENDGIITFSVTSDGTTGEHWIGRLGGNGFRLSSYAKSVLRSPKFQPTAGITTQVAVLKGMLFNDNGRTTDSVRTEATRRTLMVPNAEVACLVREKFTDEEVKEMSLIWLVTMHEPIDDSGLRPDLLCADRDDDGPLLNAFCGRLGRSWPRGSGFVFAVA